MKKLVFIGILISCVFASNAQSLTQIKKELEATPDPIGYVKFKLKKKYKIDSIVVVSTANFMGIADSLTYHGKVGKVYGPFKKANYLIKLLFKAPNTFYHVQHIVLDTAVYRSKFAESLADSIINKINSKTETFAKMASVYSADYQTAIKGGDLGWFVKGIMLPQLDRELVKRKKGELFKVWTEAGLHVVRIVDNPKKDTGYGLLLRVIL
ncbi:MAG: peptidyl-prolyl cis-trans isomerase [Ferruginibacter sp.]|nr:peptidyl-prolyl cis-trans isomerase [Ferruginibacter sp.]